MGWFSELDNLKLPQLIERFEGEPLEGLDILFFQEVAIRIRKTGQAGFNYLLERYNKESEPERRQGILAGLAHLDTDSDRVIEILTNALEDPNFWVVTAAIDVMLLKVIEAENRIVPYFQHTSPYIRASVIRYISRLYEGKAMRFLVQGTKDPHPIVRMNVADEIGTVLEKNEDHPLRDELIKLLNELKQDQHDDVREAAKWALGVYDNDLF